MNEILPIHHKYGYSSNEQLLMLLITAITNFIGIPCTIYLYRMGRIFESYISCFTVLTSFMYHALDSVDCPQFFLTELQWHQLDNIGSIASFMIVFVYVMDNKNEKLDFQLYLSYFTIAIFTQVKDPWNLIYTLAPIILSVVVYLIVLIFRKRKPEVNILVLAKAVFFVMIASFCFGRGLNEFQDYLRIFHGLWHLNIYIANFYLWQAKLPMGVEITWLNFWKKDMYKKSLLESDGLKEEV